MPSRSGDARREPTISVGYTDGIAVAHVVGEHDISTAAELLNVLTVQVAPAVVVSLDEATFIDSHIVRTLFLAHSALADSGRRLVIQAGTHVVVDRVLEITGIRRTLPFAETLEQALTLARPDGPAQSAA